jgi:inhibitor of cysteine peptidase
MKIVLLLVAAAAVLGLFACTTQTSSMNASVEVSIDDFTNVITITKEVELASGGTLMVTLGSNKTTGFQWSEQAEIADPSILEQTSHQYIAPQSSVEGAPGKEEWTFKALKSGITTISMEYSRPWEGGEKGVWKFNLTVNVR